MLRLLPILPALRRHAAAVDIYAMPLLMPLRRCHFSIHAVTPEIHTLLSIATELPARMRTVTRYAFMPPLLLTTRLSMMPLFVVIAAQARVQQHCCFSYA